MSKLRLCLSIVLSLLGLALITTLIASASNTIEWQLAATGLTTSGYYHDVALGDINHDGKPDLVAVGSSGIAVYAGDGAGHWAAGLNTGLSAGGLNDVALGDFNNDGAVDIIASTNSNLGVLAWAGNGAGSWTVFTTGLPITGTYAGVALGDVNRDGRLDVIAAGSGGNAPGIKVYLNTGSAFSATTPITTLGSYGRIATGLVDSDGYLDVVAADTAGGVSVWRGGSNNTWTLASTGITLTGGYRSVAWGDLNNDGKLDLVASRTGFVNQSAGGLFIFNWNDATSSWTLSPNQIPVTNSYDQIALVDVNNDGWLDVIAGGWPLQGGTGTDVWLGDPMGFSASTALTTTAKTSAIASVDFDHDGLPDVATGDINGTGLLAWRDNGVRPSLGAWQVSASPQITGSPRTLAVGDLNRDGQLDVIAARPAGGLNAWLGNGGNSWSACANFSIPGAANTGSYESVLIGPFGRSTQDMIGARVDGGGIQNFVQSSPGTCSYWTAFSITTTGSYRGLSAGDIDRDGYWEVVAAPISPNLGLRIWKNNVTWLPQGNPISTGTYYATALGDFTHSGRLQIVAASATGSGVSLFTYSSILGWLQSTITATGEYHALAVGDFNHDGNLDVAAAAGGASQGINIWVGDGSLSTWTLLTSPTTSGQYNDLEVSDFNHDGELDILAARNGEGVMIWAGDGAGNWTPDNTNLPTTGIYGAASFVHVDHDGNLDVVATAPTGAVQVWTAAEATPPTINNIRPSGWISTTQSPTIMADVLDTGSGLNVTSAQYRYSIDGGASWSGYFSAIVTGANGVTTTQVLQASSVPFNHDSGSQNKIEFGIADMVGNLGLAQGVIKIDTAPPTAPISITSSSHTTAHWSNNNQVTLLWGGATDATSGIYGYAVLFDHSPTTLPAPVPNAFVAAYVSSSLADGSTWYAHVRTVDAAGNWSTTAIHLGPFYIDTTPPTNPTSVLGAVHTPGVWSSLNTIGVGWSGASDGSGSGVSGYSYLWDTSATTLPPTSMLDNVTFAISPPQPDSNHIYVHVRTRDGAGNWATTAAHLGPFYIDTTPPQSSMSSPATSNSKTFLVFWSATDAGSGVASYDVQYRDETTGGSWKTWYSATSWTDDGFVGQDGHIYQFRVRARDNLGNVEDYRSGYDARTAVATADFSVKNPGIEINQAVQDMNNSVLLIAKKRTFVRCYVQGDGGTYNLVPARLRVYRGATLMGTLSPSNPSAAITIKPGLSRSNLNDSYYFDVPTNWLTSGNVTFQCEVNSPRRYAEINYTNNVGQTTVTFFNAPIMQLYVVDVPYMYQGTEQHIRDEDYNLLLSWLRRAYPINKLSPEWHYFTTPYDSLPDCNTVNSDLASIKFKNWYFKGEDYYLRYYGMAFNKGGFMRGCSPVPGLIASGPTGTKLTGSYPYGWELSGNWDADGNYGDWYGGHELGHAYNQPHVQGTYASSDVQCGKEANAGPYPYPNGDIGPTRDTTSPNAVFGFDSVGPAVYGPDWKDMMTYCEKQWISPYTYTGIWAEMMGETPVPPVAAARRTTSGEQLAVFGTIISPTDAITLSTFYRLPSSVEMPGRDISGTYHIKLFGVGNNLLADYPFSPTFDADIDVSSAMLAEVVPWVVGTQQIAIWHNSTALITRTVSAHAPVVMLLSPNGGETLSGDQATVTWTGSDLDNNPLTYSLDYSRDGGATWDALTGNITRTQITIDAAHLGGTTQGKFRVWASDGVNTTLDESDGTFTVTNKLPRILSIAPASGTNYIVSQTVTLEGSAIDVEDGMLSDAQLQWTSSLQGPIGTGETLQTTDLIPGTHVITLTATDSDNNVVTATTTIVINPDMTVIAGVYLPLIRR